jgi:hypothetical protein
MMAKYQHEQLLSRPYGVALEEAVLEEPEHPATKFIRFKTNNANSIKPRLYRNRGDFVTIWHIYLD